MFGKSIICMGGDLQLIHKVSEWGSVPKGVVLKSSTLNVNEPSRGIGFAASFQGSMKEIKPFYDEIISKNPSLKGHFQSSGLFVIAIKGDMSGSYLSLTEHSTSSGGKIVEILSWRKY